MLSLKLTSLNCSGPGWERASSRRKGNDVPIYEYRCEKCGNELEVMHKVSDPSPTECPKCGTGLKFTLLPPRGHVAAPLTNVPVLQPETATTRARGRREGFFESMGISEINPRYLWAGFIILVGVALVCDGLGVHIARGYLYFAMAFSAAVDLVLEGA